MTPFFFPHDLMPEIANYRDQLTVLLPKSAISKPDSRNALSHLLTQANLGDVISAFETGKDDRRDQWISNGFNFELIKDAKTLATMLDLYNCNNLPLAFIIGADVLAEAQASTEADLRQNGINNATLDIQRICRLDIGACTLKFLTKDRISESSQLSNRLIYTKYPALTRYLLSKLNISGSRVLETSGSEQRVRTFIDLEEQMNPESDPSSRVAGFEVVGKNSGATALANGLIPDLELSLPTGEDLGMPYLDLTDVTTDLCALNCSQLTDTTRDKLRALGINLESARRNNQYVTLTFNVPERLQCNFSHMGADGPTSSSLLVSDDKEPMCALQVFAPNVPLIIFNLTDEIQKLGGEYVGISKPFPVAPRSSDLETLKILPRPKK